MAFKMGQVVKLKSGGPKMTVVDEATGSSGLYHTSWFAGSKNEKGFFPEAALEDARDDVKKE